MTESTKPVVFIPALGNMQTNLLIPMEEHVDLCWRGVNDYDVTRFLSTNLPFLMRNEVQWFEGLADRRMTDQVFVIANAKLEAIGVCGLHRIDWVSRNASFGISIYAKSEWSRGHGTEALMLMLHYAFTRLNLRKVELDVLATNERAVKCYTRCGFVEEGNRREHVFKADEYHDSLSMGVFKKAWLPLWDEYVQKVSVTA